MMKPTEPAFSDYTGGMPIEAIQSIRTPNGRLYVRASDVADWLDDYGCNEAAHNLRSWERDSTDATL